MFQANEYLQFTQAVDALLPIRLSDYKQRQMERRIRDLARKHQAADLHIFAGILRADVKLLREFEQHITINVSEMYRNPDAYSYLTKTLLPQMLTVGRGLRIWSAGCSYGAEPYTLAMLAHQAAPHLKHTIHATDIDREILARAKSGKGFSQEDVRSLPAELRNEYLVRDGDTYAVSEKLLRYIRFERHDLLRDQMNQTFDMVVCRNVVIYFTDEAKERLYHLFTASLRPGGYLFIGGTETINRAALFGLRYVAPCFYQKAAS